MAKHNLLFNTALREHHNSTDGLDITSIEFALKTIQFKNDPKKICIEVDRTKQRIFSNYYIGVDWINIENLLYVSVEPKLNSRNKNPETDIQINYLGMLFSALEHSEVAAHTEFLYEIKFGLPEIEISQKKDLLTPLLVVQFLSLVKEIVRKGLKKSYYNVETNLYGKIKGKVLTGQTIKQNHFKNKPLNTFCCYDEFGLNGLENRLLKKALLFVQRYLPSVRFLNAELYTNEIFNYITPAFESVSEVININEIKHSKTNAFFKEYAEAVRLAKLILKRFGYNINNTQQDTIMTPPFWIDMSKLFELYVFGLLRKKYSDQILYSDQAKANYGLPDFLLTKEGEEMIIDTKYKSYYKNSNIENKIVDIRQLSGYSRDLEVIKKLRMGKNELIDCLIIYPDQSLDNFELDFTSKIPINGFAQFYQVGVKLPEIIK